MSLFIGNLSFSDVDILNKVRIGVILGSLSSTICGMAAIYIAIHKKK